MRTGLGAESDSWDDAFCVECPQCDARQGEVCITGYGGPHGLIRRVPPHPLRVLAAQIVAGTEEGDSP